MTSATSQEKAASVTVKCVCCGHRETIPLTQQEPMCQKCFGPVVAEKVERRVRSMLKLHRELP